MKNFKAIWKTLVDAKQIRVQDTIAYAILRAMASKSDNKREIARYFVAKSFTKRLKGGMGYNPYQAAITAHFKVLAELKWGKKILQTEDVFIFDSDEEMETFKELLESLKPFDFDRVYTYVFVRQDLTPEYQLVQAAHATMVLGKNLAEHHNPNETYFTVIGVENLKALNEVKKHVNDSGFEFEEFIEPDIGHEATAIAVHPIHWMARRPLKNYQLLTFSS